jgi:hypothetical protein
VNCGVHRSSVPFMTLGHEIPEKVQQALDEWAPFPVDRQPRPLVLLAAKVRALGFPDGATKRAFVDRAFEGAPGFPPRVLEAMAKGSIHRSSSSTNVVLTSAKLEECEFKTDRGPRALPAWRVEAAGIQQPIWVLDPAVEHTIWEPVGGSMVGLSTATTRADGRTITMAFVGGPAEHTDYPDARVYERGAAVAVLPIGLSKIPPEQPRHAIGAQRRVTVVLTQPLGGRVLLDGGGHPVVVEELLGGGVA